MPADTQRAYHRALSTIEKNAGDPQPVLLKATSLWQSLVANGSLGHGVAENALRAATENGHVVRWTDTEGQYRYGLTVDGVAELPNAGLPVYDAADESALRDVIETEAARAEPNQAVIGWANQHLQSLREADND